MCSMKIVGEPVKSLNLYKSHACSQCTVEPRYNDPYYKDVPGIRVNIIISTQS